MGKQKSSRTGFDDYSECQSYSLPMSEKRLNLRAKKSKNSQQIQSCYSSIYVYYVYCIYYIYCLHCMYKLRHIYV